MPYDPKTRFVDTPDMRVVTVEVADIDYDCIIIANIWLRDRETIVTEKEEAADIFVARDEQGRVVKIQLGNSLHPSDIDAIINDPDEACFVKNALPLGFIKKPEQPRESRRELLDTGDTGLDIS